MTKGRYPLGKAVLAIILGLLLAWGTLTPAAAKTYTFSDTHNFWPGWGNESGDDSHDTIGTPNFSGGTADINKGYLTSITFTFYGQVSTAWDALEPGDLFLDLGADSDWDYVVYLDQDPSTKASERFADNTKTDIGAGSYSLFSVDIALGSSSYQSSGNDNSVYWSGYGIRDKHPVGLASKPTGDSVGTVDFSGWPTSTDLSKTGASGSVAFDFTNLNNGSGLWLGGEYGAMILGFQPNCANDVIYEQVAYHSPEPASMLLLGTGLLGLAGYARKRRHGLPQAALAESQVSRSL